MRELVHGVGRQAALAWVCAFVLAAAGCGKTSEDSPAKSGNGGDTAGGDASGGGAAKPDAAGGTSANAGASGTAAESGAAGADESSSAALPSELRRLTAAEYTATVADELGTTQTPDLSAFDTEVDGFDNNAAANTVSDPLYFRYLVTAESLADEVFASDSLRALIVTCEQADDMSCVGQIISQTGLRLFRRPLLDAEIAGYQKAYARARSRSLSHEDALKEVLTALLASAQFLYRMELVPTAAGTQPVGQYELATRLSYLLWSSAPDAPLLDAAKRSALTSNEQLAATVTVMLQDPKAQRFAQNFAGQWLGARNLTTVSFDPLAYPEWSPDLASAAANELLAYFSELLGEDQSWLGFFDSRAHFVNTKLATLYGLMVAGPATQRVLVDGADRRGFLGLVGFLAQTSALSRSSPSQRGAWILRELLCSPLPDSPPDMPAFDDNEDSIRAYLDGLSPECTGCHSQIDSLGLALENYDAIGQYRTTYQDFTAIDATVTLPVSVAPAGSAPASGMAGVSDALAHAPAFTDCTTQKLYGYGFGRSLTEGDRTNVQTLAQQWRSGSLTLRNLIVRLVQSPTFRTRSDGGSL